MPESKPAWINWCLGSAVMLIKCLRLASKLFYWYYDKVCSFLILGLDQMWVLYVAKFFCLLLGSQVGGEHGCSTVLWLRRVWNPWRHKKSLLKIQPIPWAISWLSLTYFPTFEVFSNVSEMPALQAFDIHYWINEFALMLLCSPDPYRSWVWDFGAPILFVFPLSMWTVGIAEQLFWVADSVG